MRVKEVASRLGWLFLLLAFFAVGIAISILFIHGAAWASAKLLPIFSSLTWITLAIVVLILLPLGLPQATRKFAGVAMSIIAYVFVATLWMMGLLLTLEIWGVTGVLIGIGLAGVGVVPIAMLATLFHGYWLPLLELILLAAAFFGCHIGAYGLIKSVEE